MSFNHAVDGFNKAIVIHPLVDRESTVQADFAKFNPIYKRLRAERAPRVRILGKQVFEKEEQHSDFACAHQILSEIKWLMDSTADFKRIDKRLDDIQRVLARPEEESLARQQNSVDGSWGSCYTEWFFKLDATYDYVHEHNLTYPLHFLDRVNSPEKLSEYFSSIAVSNIAENGVDHRRELNESLADLLRFILRDRPTGYTWASGIKPAIM